MLRDGGSGEISEAIEQRSLVCVPSFQVTNSSGSFIAVLLDDGLWRRHRSTDAMSHGVFAEPIRSRALHESPTSPILPSRTEAFALLAGQRGILRGRCHLEMVGGGGGISRRRRAGGPAAVGQTSLERHPRDPGLLGHTPESDRAARVESEEVGDMSVSRICLVEVLEPLLELTVRAGLVGGQSVERAHQTLLKSLIHTENPGGVRTVAEQLAGSVGAIWSGLVFSPS